MGRTPPDARSLERSARPGRARRPGHGSCGLPLAVAVLALCALVLLAALSSGLTTSGPVESQQTIAVDANPPAD